MVISVSRWEKLRAGLMPSRAKGYIASATPSNILKYWYFLAQPASELLARPRYPGLQGADRTATQGGGLLVREATGTHQHECLARLRAELPQRRGQFLQGERCFRIV